MLETTDSEAAADAAWHAAIVRRVLAGDVSAYGALVARHRARCLRYAHRMLRDRDEAEDVTQEAYVRAFRSLARCQDPERFGAWLFSILVNRCRSALEKRVRRDRLFANQAPVTEEWVEPDAARLYDGANVSLAQVEDALQRLTAPQREAFLLKHVEEMTYEDMAVVTGTNISALKMRVSRARELLRGHLSEVYDG